MTVNGKAFSGAASSTIRLADFLRENLHLTGTKIVCSEGECGACSIIMDGKVVDSCLILAVEADGSSITTIEGLPGNDELTRLQQSFIDHHAVQCGYCIPGMILTGESILETGKILTRESIKDELAGNICRCTGYHKIIDAIINAGEPGA